MGKRGPIPNPRSKRQLTGNASKRALPPAAKPDDTLPEPDPLAEAPAWLSAEGKAYWKRVVPILAPRLKLNALDWPLVVQLCQSWAEFQEATQTVDMEGRYYEASNGNKSVHPALKRQSQAMSLFLRYAEQFGLTPKSRKRLEHLAMLDAPAAPPGPSDDSFDEFLQR